MLHPHFRLLHTYLPLLTVSPRGPTSHVHRGAAFERHCLQLLQDQFSMDLRRVGGRNDGGIDLVGWWWIPTGTENAIESGGAGGARRIRVIAQCKSERKKFKPSYVREMEGVVYRAKYPSSFPGNESTVEKEVESDDGKPYPTVALLISASVFTPATLLRALSSPVPFFLLHVPPQPSLLPSFEASDVSGNPGGAFWNAALGGANGVLRGKMEVRWERKISEDGQAVGRPGLWYEGERVGKLC
jgi:hypothetical protein